MKKQFISLLLSCLFLLSLALPAFAEEAQAEEQALTAEHTIQTVEEFLDFAEDCRLDSYSIGLVVSLEADIDLTGTSFSGIPIFCGTFLGNGHTISGLCLDFDGSDLGLFRYLTATAAVERLNVTGNITPGGSRSRIGGIAGRNEGAISLCSFTGTVSGGDTVGGLVGENTVTGIIERCKISGSIQGSHFIGGIAGENSGVIRSCVNLAQINTTAQQNSVSLSDITIDSLTNSESINTVTDIGGIAGTSTGVIRGCRNLGNVGYPHMGYNIGGIVGTQSGYIVDCLNNAQIQGRKEVGGIVGQMEPVSLIEYTEDTLQILQGQLSSMSGLVSQASSNAQTNASQITGQISVLQDQAQTAKEAVDTMLPDLDDPSLPDVDSILAAQNTLTSTISAMPGTMNSIASATQTTVSGLTQDLQAISGQISAMGETINSASEHLGGSITDVSDQDTDETLSGKVESCKNYGAVLADWNVGGVTGAIAVENDLDLTENWEQAGEDSMNFESEVRAVVLTCENHATVSGKKQNAGGIVGWQSMGLVKNCANTGTLDAQEADHVGGIVGMSSGYLRHGSAQCSLSGSSYVGGIAGSGTIISDCHSMVRLRGNEKLGAILGCAEESDSEDGPAIRDNYYLAIDTDLGGIDGVSYSGSAQPLTQDAFLSLENLAELFQDVTVRFRFEDGTETSIILAPGSSLDPDAIPSLPEKEGYSAHWEGLETADLTNVVFDLTFDACYTLHSATIESTESRENGLPLVLFQGSFTGDTTVSAAASDAAPAPAERKTLLEAWTLLVSDAPQVTAARFLLPDSADSDRLVLYVQSGSQWTQRGYTLDGRYIVFSWSQEDAGIALMAVQPVNCLPYAAGAGALVLALALLLILRKKKTRKQAPEENPT